MKPGSPGQAVAGAWLAAALALALTPAATATLLASTPAIAAQSLARQAQLRSRSAAAPQGQPARRDIGGPEMASTGIVVNYPSRGARRLPRIPASAYVLADANTGTVLAAKDPHGLFPPASTLKVLTAITLIPRLNPRAMVLATHRAASTEENDVGLRAGRQYKVADLFRALLLISANDAAVALAQATGSVKTAIALMNAEAHRLQAYDVVAKQPNGLPAKGRVVSAYDEALIARQALAMPAFMKYDSTLTAKFPVTPRHRVTLVNQNTLLTQYRGGIGGKIGWTVKSKATYIGLARRHGVTLIVTILHCTPLREIKAGERLLNWGFAMAGRVRPVGVLVPPLASTSAHPVVQRKAGASHAGTGRPGAAGHAGTGRPSAAGRAGTAGTGEAGHTGAAGISTASHPGSSVPTAPAVAIGVIAVTVLGLAGIGRYRRRRHAIDRRSMR